MSKMHPSTSHIEILEDAFGDRLERDAAVARYTSMQVGGSADFLLRVRDGTELEEAVRLCWEGEIPFMILGGGCNVLVSDAGIRKLVVLNRAKDVQFDVERGLGPLIWAESGANLGTIARRAASRGWSGLEWAEGVPGSVGGAAVNNAGAHNSDMSKVLHLAEILHHDHQAVRRLQWSAEDFGYDYRSSLIKRGEVEAVVLATELILEHSTPEAVKETMGEFATWRREHQPQGATIGSMFKNPPDDYAGRLIDEAGLKGTRRGEIEISPVHANFFINHGGGTAQDVYRLIRHTKQVVADKFDVQLELEIELIGEWQEGIEDD